ncbi:hypothetical protein RND81_04G199200 [Saponaria officinalis]|uniref:Peptidase A1 domain-containing protein n=1 Tax=Saponaria officinalis TaxID=3572 RepID=A0AAW1LG81_SAPOF
MSKTIFILFYFIIVTLLISDTNEFSIKMIPINSPHLKIIPSNLTIHQHHQLLANISMSRVLKYRNDSNGLGLNQIKSTVYAQKTSYYVTQVHLEQGRSPQGISIYSTYLLLDTACFDTWLQCDGCNPCIEVAGSNFNQSKSASFRGVAADDIICLLTSGFDVNGVCGYTSYYAGMKSRTTGILGRNTFYFMNPRTNSFETYPNYVFGCGLRNENFVFGENKGPRNLIAGIFGLAVGPRSFITQLEAYTRSRFAYCLPLATPEGVAESTLYFGSDAQISGDGMTTRVQRISMFTKRVYHLYLIGISVDGNRVQINPSIFTLDEIGLTRGFFIDSGTPYTTLARSAYNPLRSAMVKYFLDNYGWKPKKPTPENVLDLCYRFYPKEGQSFPKVTFHFFLMNHPMEVDMELKPSNVFAAVEGGFCMMIISTNDPGPSIFGAFQQSNIKFLFDVKNNYLYFVPEDCLEDVN